MSRSTLARRVESVGDRPPLATMGRSQWIELHAFLDEADAFEDLPGKWQAAIAAAERAGAGEEAHGGPAGCGCCCCSS